MRLSPPLETETAVLSPMAPHAELPAAAAAVTAFLCILFGANAVAIKISLAGIGTFTAAGTRFTIGAITLFLWAWFTEKPLKLNSRQVRQVLVLCLFFTIQLACFYSGLKRTTASHGTLIANLLPFNVLILAHFFIPGDRITLKRVTGLILGFTGVVFLLMDATGGAPSTTVQTGDLIVFLAVLVWGGNAVYIKTIIHDFHPVQITLFPMAFGGAVFFAAGCLLDDPMIRFLDARIILAFLYTTFVTAAFGFVAWNTLLSRFGATALHSFIFIMPLSGVFFGILLLDEPVTPHLVAAIAFIVLGICVVHSRKRIKRRHMPF